MTCQYPNCYHVALYTPVVELPTIRTSGDSTTFVETDQPTTLLMREVCQAHRDIYNLSDWIPPADWAYIQEAARSRGYQIPRPDLIIVTFRPIGWKPRRTIPLERSQFLAPRTLMHQPGSLSRSRRG